MSGNAVTFEERLKEGSAGEARIARWFRRRGYSVLPAYEKIINTGKGPRLFTASTQLVAPDLLVFNADKVFWIEAKHKTAFSWHRITGRWVTGIDLHHYKDYCRIDDDTPWPVWLLFLHEGGRAKDSPADSPGGLFGNSLTLLRDHVNHTSDEWGPSGMVYWAHQSLLLIAELTEVK